MAQLEEITSVLVDLLNRVDVIAVDDELEIEDVAPLFLVKSELDKFERHVHLSTNQNFVVVCCWHTIVDISSISLIETNPDICVVSAMIVDAEDEQALMVLDQLRLRFLLLLFLFSLLCQTIVVFFDWVWPQ